MIDTLLLPVGLQDEPEPTGNAARFEERWHLVAGGLANVWRYGFLELPSPSGRLLLRGPNGTGKTTALEGLCPYLLDLNARQLNAGRARTTSLSSLMEEGSNGKGGRIGYMWLTFASPDGSDGEWTYGVRLQWKPGNSPATKVVPFRVPGRPERAARDGGLALFGAGGVTATTLEDFTSDVTNLDGDVYTADPDEYVNRLAAHVFGTDAAGLRALTELLRTVRNPSNLGDLSAKGAGEALREALPYVDPAVVVATGVALAESETTREAFRRDTEAADTLGSFADAWAGHVVDVVRKQHAATAAKVADVAAARTERDRADAAASTASTVHEKHQTTLRNEQDALADAQARKSAAEKSEAYQAAGRLDDLRAKAEAQANTAFAELGAVRRAAAALVSHNDRAAALAVQVADDVTEQVEAAVALDAAAHPGEPLVTSSRPMRAVLSVAGTSVTPGAGLVVHADAAVITGTAERWRELGRGHQALADKALMVLKAAEEVQRLDIGASDAERDAGRDAVDADEGGQRLRTAREAAGRERTGLQSLVAEWMEQHPDLASDVYDEQAVEALAGATDDDALRDADAWATAILGAGEARAGRWLAQVEQLRAQSAAVREQAAVLRSDAQELRSGRLLPMPRPAWAGPAVDETATVGSALDWAPGSSLNALERDALEQALADAGVLGATLAEDGATTDRWRVLLDTPALPGPVLADVLTADPDHPSADAAQRLLQRVGLGPGAAQAAGLRVAVDSQWQAGPLTASVGPVLAPASHIGSRQRREAALARALVLEQEAASLKSEADRLTADADEHAGWARDIRSAARTFPSRQVLRAATADLVSAAKAHDRAVQRAEASEQIARQRRAAHRDADAAWADQVRSFGLPIALDELRRLRDRGRVLATGLTRAADTLTGKLLPRMRDLLGDAQVGVGLHEELVGLAGRARQAHDTAVRAEAQHDELVALQGSAVAEVLAALKQAESDERESKLKVEQDQDALIEADRQRVQTAAALDVALERVTAAQPEADQAMARLAELLRTPGVLPVLGLGTLPDPDETLERVGAAVQGRPTRARATVREQYEQAKADLAGSWALDFGDDVGEHGELATFVLTHTDQTYTPPTAAAHAARLRDAASSALASSEERALREFVIGRLPNAVGVAWQRLLDWRDEVNSRMRMAKASSGVGVQVHVTRRDDLSAAQQTLYTVACKTGAAERTARQKQQVGEALQQLIDSALGESMTERVADAVDIRSWVHVSYLVERPGQPPVKWGLRTGLSGGERRLVVLAPMLAAVASRLDRHEPGGVRLVTLDEVPAEVDEAGRSGLARYMAALDMDLICTSYLWDGAPGAWDGIDGHDLEQAADGTVVAFPMLVRGLLPLPGDTWDDDPLDPS